MKPIIALTDFSPISINAVNYAADMAVAAGSSLYVLHICLVPMAFSELPYPADSLGGMVKDAETELAQLKKELAGRTAGKIKIHGEVRTGSLIPETDNYCNSHDPYFVVMGTQGNSAIERVFWSSNTAGMIKNASWPLVIVPPEARFTGIKKIGFACDLEDVNETTPFDALSSLVKELKAELYILHVNPENKKHYSAEKMTESRSLQNRLEDLHPDFHFISNTDIEEGISRFTEENQLDLLIVVPKKHNLLGQVFHKSQSKKLALHTHVPLLSIHE